MAAVSISSTAVSTVFASSARPSRPTSSAYSFPYFTNMPAMNTLSALPLSKLEQVWKLSPGVRLKQLRLRQSFQSARPMSGSPCGPRWVSV